MWFLCYFLHRLLDFRLPEVEALSALFMDEEEEEEDNKEKKQHLRWKQPLHHHADSPLYFVDLPSEAIARKIANRSLLIKGIFEVWGEGRSYEELQASIEEYPDERKAPYLAHHTTFKLVIDCFGKVLTHREQTERIESFDYIPFKGRVNLKDPQYKFWLIETDSEVSNNGLPPAVQKTFLFGREIGGADRSLLVKYQLSRRRYLGPTAMDAEVAFLMVHQALAKAGKFIYDPFVGTGSILVAAAHYGAITLGADIDIRVVRDGRGPDCNVWSNFKQYNLQPPVGLIRADNNAPPWRSNLKKVFDAIICDPPYGLRAGGRKSGGRKLLKGIKESYTIPDEKRNDHIPSTAPYTLEECVDDLFDMAARLLVLHGRLVFFYPVANGQCSKAKFPQHACFTLVASSEQILSSKYSRCLLTMVKTSEYTKEVASDYFDKHLHYRQSHAKSLDENRLNENLHMLVFSPADSYSSNGYVPGDKLDSRPKYRSKYV